MGRKVGLLIAVAGLWAFSHPQRLYAENEAICAVESLQKSPLNGFRVYAPDGTRYLVNKEDAQGFDQIYISSTGGDDLVCITCEERPGGPKVDRLKMQPAWHPSGRWIFLAVERDEYAVPPLLINRDLVNFWMTRGVVEGILQSGIWVNMYAVSPDGQTWHRLTDFKTAVPGVADGYTGPAFTSDGKTMVWSQAMEPVAEGKIFGGWHLTKARFVETGGVPSLADLQNITPPGMHWNEIGGGFDTDNETILMTGSMEFDAQGMDQYLLNTRTGALQNLTNSPTTWDEHGVFSPDRKKIIFMSAYPYRDDLNASKVATIKTEFMLMNRDGSGLTQLTHFKTPGYPESGEGIAANPSWARDGRSVSLRQLVFPDYQDWILTFAGACGKAPPPNQAPVASGQAVTGQEDTALSITLAGSDPDGGTLTYTIVAQPQHGSLSGSGAARIYTPAAQYNGPDSFTFRVNDGSADSNIATVSLTIAAVNDPPVAVLTATPASGAAPLSVSFNGGGSNDIEGALASYSWNFGDSSPAATGSQVQHIYASGGSYTAVLTVTDSGGATAQASRVISVDAPVNLPPTATPQSLTTNEDTVKGVTLAGSDPEGSALTFAIAAAPQHGTLSGSGANRTYTPAPNYSGTDSFTFRINDGSQDSNMATVSLTITPVNDAPAAVLNAQPSTGDTPLEVSFDGAGSSDVEAGALSYEWTFGDGESTITTQPSVRHRYTRSGLFTAVLKVVDAEGLHASASLNITVNDPASGLPLDIGTFRLELPDTLSLQATLDLTVSNLALFSKYEWSLQREGGNPSGSGSAASLQSFETPLPRASLGDYDIAAGRYRITVTGRDATGRTLASAEAGVTLVSPHLSSVRVYPNPWRANLHASYLITFDNLTAESTVKIFDIAGRSVRTLPAPAGQIQWDRKNDHGDFVASGIYLYLITDPSGSKARGKFTIIR